MSVSDAVRHWRYKTYSTSYQDFMKENVCIWLTMLVLGTLTALGVNPKARYIGCDPHGHRPQASAPPHLLQRSARATRTCMCLLFRWGSLLWNPRLFRDESGRSLPLEWTIFRSITGLETFDSLEETAAVLTHSVLRICGKGPRAWFETLVWRRGRRIVARECVGRSLEF